MASDGYEIVVTHTAKSKAFRYLNEHEIAECVRSPWQVYYDETRDSYLLRTDRRPDAKNFGPGRQPSKKDRIVLIAVVKDDSEEIVIVSQTKDHYDWSEYEGRDSIGVPIAGDHFGDEDREIATDGGNATSGTERFGFEEGDTVCVRVREHGTSGNIVAKFTTECAEIDTYPTGRMVARFELPGMMNTVAYAPYEAEFEVVE